MQKNEIIAKVSEFCHDNLLNDKDALDYISNIRKIDEKYIKKYQIGLFPKINMLFDIVNPVDLREAGMIKNVSKSVFTTYDIVMPVRDLYGNYVAIAGRTRLSDDSRNKLGIPKYINSVYNKTHHLFGLNFAKQHILKNNLVYVVEGYFDVISAVQNGLNNVVAVCGSYLTFRQLSILYRYTNKVCLLFDNEELAQSKANKIVQKKKRDGIELMAKMPFPKAIKDIDDFFKIHTIEEFNKIMAGENGL